MSWLYCPYCKKGMDINSSDLPTTEGISESHKCNHCKKTFAITVATEYDTFGICDKCKELYCDCICFDETENE